MGAPATLWVAALSATVYRLITKAQKTTRPNKRKTLNEPKTFHSIRVSILAGRSRG